MSNLEYPFNGDVSIWSGKKADWFFITVPKEVSDHVRYFTSHIQRGFKSVKVKVKIGTSEWETSLFPSKERQSYILPVKKSVRQAEKIGAGDSPKVHITILD